MATEEIIGSCEAAMLLMHYLQRRGAIFRIKPDGYLHANLDAVNPASITMSQDTLAGIILHLAPEIEQLLRAETARRH